MQSKIGEIYEGRVSGITSFGAFVRLSNGETGMVHISEIAAVYVKDINEHLSVGQNVRVKVIGVNEAGKISLSMKQADENNQKEPARTVDRRRAQTGAPQKRRSAGAPRQNASQTAGPSSFEDMMAKFKKDSDEKISVLKRSTDFKGGNKRGGR